MATVTALTHCIAKVVQGKSGPGVPRQERSRGTKAGAVQGDQGKSGPGVKGREVRVAHGKGVKGREVKVVQGSDVQVVQDQVQSRIRRCWVWRVDRAGVHPDISGRV